MGIHPVDGVLVGAPSLWLFWMGHDFSEVSGTNKL
jgi:hypothetical protein